MKTLTLALAGAVMATGFVAVAPEPAEAAGPFDKLKKAKKKAERAARDVDDAVRTGDTLLRRGRNAKNTVTGATGSKGGSAGRPGPAPAKYTAVTKCANVSIQNAFIGRMGDYTFQNGLTQESRSGLIEREPVNATGGCIMPSMKTYDWLYMEIPTAQLASMKGGFKMQCVDAATGKNANSEAFPRWYNLKGKDVALHTGHSLPYKTTASGSNSDRSGAWDKDLKRRGMTMFGFNMPPLHNDSGTNFYCQYYNAATGQSVAAFQYRRSAG